jgi:hypothetical protein
MARGVMFGRLEYQWDNLDQRMRWFLRVPGSTLDNLPLATDRAGSLEIVRQINRVRRQSTCCGNIYVAGI